MMAMMAASESHLLRTVAQAEAFTERNREAIERNAGPLYEWFGRLPLYEWVAYRPEPGTEEIITGILCLLYMTGKINLSFSRDMRYVQRGALSPEEDRQWEAKHCNNLKLKRK